MRGYLTCQCSKTVVFSSFTSFGGGTGSLSCGLILQLIATMVNSIQALTTTSVDVRLTAVVAANGAAVNATILASFPRNKSSNAQLYVAALLGNDSSSIFAPTLGPVAVDPLSVHILLAVHRTGMCSASPCKVGLAMLPVVPRRNHTRTHVYMTLPV